MFVLKFLLSLVGVFYCHLQQNELHQAHSSGDIMIGGLFPIHLKVINATSLQEVACTEYDVQGFLLSQVMIYTIEEINRHTPRILPNLTLGYRIFDTCGNVSLAIRATLELLRNDSDKCFLPSDIHLALPEPQTKVVIGARYSEVSTAVARVTALASLAQISYASSSVVLSQKFRFPTFLRTVSSDAFQTEGIYELVHNFNWRSVAIVGSDDEYGKYGSDRLEEIFNQRDICVEFVKILPGNFNQNNSKELVKTLNESIAEAIILFTKAGNVEMIMKEAIDRNLNRTWIASDAWSTSLKILMMKNISRAGQVLGFMFKRNEVPGFEEYVKSRFNGNNNSFLEHYKATHLTCVNHETECFEKLVSNINQSASYSIYLAIHVVARSLRSLLKCDDQRCERSLTFTTSELLEEIKKANITVDDTRVYFIDGDPRLGYDIVQWDFSGTETLIKTIGEYWPDKQIKLPEDLKRRMQNTVSVFNCSKTCAPGQMLKCQRQKCCYDCVRCADGEFSENGTACQRCEDDEHSSEGIRIKCIKNPEDFLQWNDPFSIVLMCSACMAITVTLKITFTFSNNHTTPIVKAVGGYLCFVELLSLLFCFSLTFTFMGKPTSFYSCLGIPLFGTAFSICISCILANLLQIMVGFTFKLNVGSWIKKLNQPLAVVIIISGIQVVLTVSWLFINPPSVVRETANHIDLHQCNMEVNEFFITTTIYSVFLCIACFLFAVKGRELPDLYKNSTLISASMAVILINWLVFFPLLISLRGKYRPAVTCAAILISSGSILCCHLVPKCYIIMFRKELNNEKALTEYIRKYYEKKGVSVVPK